VLTVNIDDGWGDGCTSRDVSTWLTEAGIPNEVAK